MQTSTAGPEADANSNLCHALLADLLKAGCWGEVGLMFETR